MSFQPTDYVAADAMTFLMPLVPFAGSIVRNSYSKSNAIMGDQPGSWSKAGNSVSYRFPYMYDAFYGADQTSNFQTPSDRIKTFSLFQSGVPLSVPWTYTSDQITLFVDKDDVAKKTILNPTMSTLAAKVEASFLNQIVPLISNVVGTQGALMNTISTALDAQAFLTDGSVMPDERIGVLTPATANAMVASEASYFNPTKVMSEQFETGVLQDAQGVEYLQSNLLPTLTMGTATFTSAHVHGAVAGSATGIDALPVEGLGAGTVTTATKFSIAGVWDVEPATKTRLPRLKQFSVIEAETVASSEATFAISPAIITTGAYRNVSTDEVANVIPTNAVITLNGGLAVSESYRPNILYHPEAFCGVTVENKVPKTGVIGSAQKVYKGFNLTLVGTYDARLSKEFWRFDCISGADLVRPELAVMMLDGMGSIA